MIDQKIFGIDDHAIDLPGPRNGNDAFPNVLPYPFHIAIKRVAPSCPPCGPGDDDISRTGQGHVHGPQDFFRLLRGPVNIHLMKLGGRGTGHALGAITSPSLLPVMTMAGNPSFDSQTSSM